MSICLFAHPVDRHQSGFRSTSHRGAGASGDRFRRLKGGDQRPAKPSRSGVCAHARKPAFAGTFHSKRLRGRLLRYHRKHRSAQDRRRRRHRHDGYGPSYTQGAARWPSGLESEFCRRTCVSFGRCLRPQGSNQPRPWNWRRCSVAGRSACSDSLQAVELLERAPLNHRVSAMSLSCGATTAIIGDSVESREAVRTRLPIQSRLYPVRLNFIVAKHIQPFLLKLSFTIEFTGHLARYRERR